MVRRGQAATARLVAEAAAESHRVKTEAQIKALKEREVAAKAYSTHPGLWRLQELETLRELARTAKTPASTLVSINISTAKKIRGHNGVGLNRLVDRETQAFDRTRAQAPGGVARTVAIGFHQHAIHLHVAGSHVKLCGQSV